MLLATLLVSLPCLVNKLFPLFRVIHKCVPDKDELGEQPIKCVW